MASARASILIDRPAPEVYAFIADDFTRNYRRWSPEVQRLEMLTPGPLRVGSRARQVRVDQGRRTDCTFRITALDRPSRVCFAETGDQFRIEYLIVPGAGGAAEAPTRLTFGFQLNRLELDMRPFEKLIRAALQDGAERVVRNLKRLVESEHTPSSQRPPGPPDRAS
jgi:hypothetical protein